MTRELTTVYCFVRSFAYRQRRRCQLLGDGQHVGLGGRPPQHPLLVRQLASGGQDGVQRSQLSAPAWRQSGGGGRQHVAGGDRARVLLVPANQ